MESPWNEDEKDERLIGIVRDIKASKDYWEDHATGLFAPNRISILQQAIMAMNDLPNMV